MHTKLDPLPFRITTEDFTLSAAKTKIKDLYVDASHYEELLINSREQIDELQQQMYAQDRYALLVIFQAMDAAGKDGTIKHVLSGINPQGLEVHSFKRPSEEELDHDFMWRTMLKLPPRGRIGIFNRSYYEEVLICKVHPEIIQNYQRIPDEEKKDINALFKHRYEDIAAIEKYAHRNGIRIMKIMLNVSQAEQEARFIGRIDTPAKNWKFNSADLAERAHWQAYMAAYQDAIRATATADSPWYVIPADDKKNARLLTSAAILHELKKLKLTWPELPPSQLADLAKAKATLLAE